MPPSKLITANAWTSSNRRPTRRVSIIRLKQICIGIALLLCAYNWYLYSVVYQRINSMNSIMTSSSPADAAAAAAADATATTTSKESLITLPHDHDRIVVTQDIFQNVQFMQDSCSQLMGNSFTSKKQVCSHVTCWTSSDLHSSNCWLQNVTLYTDRFTVARGGVEIEHVLGQDEKDEFPTYSSNAWMFKNDSLQEEQGGNDGVSSSSNNSNNDNRKKKSCTKEAFENHPDLALPHYLNQIKEAIGVSSSSPLAEQNCSLTITKPTFAITRYDYANLFHTMCDWYNFYQAIQLYNHRNTDIQVLLLDGHPSGNLDESWSTVFGQTLRISDLQQDQYTTVCFHQLYLVGPGYHSPFFPDSLPLSRRCFGSIHVQDFRNSFLSKHGIISSSSSSSSSSNEETIHHSSTKNTTTILRIGYLFRKDYLAHPRQGSQPRVSRKIQNEQQLLTSIQDFLHQYYPNTLLIPLYLETLTLKEQLEQMAHLHILVGMHGAGLSHVLFMNAGTLLIELAPMSHARLPFFEIMAHINGVTYIKQSQGITEYGGGGENFYVDPNIHISTLKEALQQIIKM